jgi:hypothetical protein
MHSLLKMLIGKSTPLSKLCCYNSLEFYMQNQCSPWWTNRKSYIVEVLGYFFAQKHIHVVIPLRKYSRVVPWGAMLGNYLRNKFWGRMSMTNPPRKHVKVNSPMEACWWNFPRKKACIQFLEETCKGQFMWGNTLGVIFKRKNSKGFSSRKYDIFLP